MSDFYTIPAPPVPQPRTSRLVSWIAGGTAVSALLATLAIAAWPASAADQARADGERYGQAVSDLYAAQSPAEVDAALSDMHGAAADARDHAGDEVADQVAAQEDALARAADGFVGTNTSDASADLYQAELDVAVDDLSSQAADFRDQGPDVRQAFWDGVDDGLTAA